MQIRLNDVSYAFGSKYFLFENLRYKFQRSSITGIVGPSGTGKTTLLEVIGGKRTPTRGEVLYERHNSFPADTRIYPRDISFVNQTTPVMPGRTAMENVQVALVCHGVRHSTAERLARQALAVVGLKSHGERDISKLSGGEVQRVCVARALVSPAPIVLADEPTAQLDRASARSVSTALRALAQSGKLVIISTHDLMLAGECDSVLEMG